MINEKLSNEAQKLPLRKGVVSGSGIRSVILTQAITFLFSSIMWWVNDDMDKWFTRWVLGMLLLSAWGIMKHLSNHCR
jgi:hypothetical protein